MSISISNYDFKNLKALKEFLIKASEAYYNTEESIIPDEVFDKMVKYYESESDETFQVGANVTIGRTTDLSHSYSDFAGTLSKANSMDDIRKWYKKKGLVNTAPVYISLKADGHSITVEVKNVKGKPVIDKALTRGKDGKGKDLTALFKKYSSQIALPNLKCDYAIGFEAIVTTDNFNAFCEKEGNLYKSPRSIIGGIFSEDGEKYFPYISLIALRVKYKEGWITRDEQIDIVNTYNNNNTIFDTYFEVFNSLAELEETYQWATEERFNLGMMCDGLVIEIVDEEIRKKLGYSSTAPNFAIALKFPNAEKETEVTKIVWSTEGNSSRHTPMVHFKPVTIIGITYSKVSLANYDRFMNLQLKVGDKVKFTRNNDVLGYIDKVNTDVNKGNKNPVIKPITNCLKCNSDLVINGAFLECHNSSCELNELGNILQFVDCMDIKFLGRKTLEKLYSEKVISKFSDFFDLKTNDYGRITKISGLGNAVVKLIKEMISNLSKEGVLDYKFMAGFNIPLLGRDRWKLILNTIDLDKLTDMINEDPNGLTKLLSKIDGVGPNTIDAILEAFSEENGNKRDEFDDFLLSSIKILSSKSNKSFVQRADALSFCITGSADPFKTRNAIEEFIQSKGHKLVTGVSKKTNYLITNDKHSGTTKNAKAESLGVPILTVQEMKDMLDSE